MPGLASMSTLATLIVSGCCPAISSSTGAMALQGPHHGAQKSTRTVFSLFRTLSLNDASVMSTVLAMWCSVLLSWLLLVVGGVSVTILCAPERKITANVRGPIRAGSASAWARVNACRVDRLGVGVLSVGE